MPNTLAHLGVQTLVSKSICRSADFKWIALGCILPDIPWIMQRILYPFPGMNIIDLRLYSMIQASLFFSLLLSGAISLLTRDGGRVFLLLAGNCFMHLLIDAFQIKWANGVHLLAPFSWQLTGFHLFWPEQLPSSLMSVLGLIVLIFFGIKDGPRPVRFNSNRNRLILSALLASVYLLTPPLFFQGPLQADNHFIATLRDKEQRPGRYVAFDRDKYDHATQSMRIFTGETLTVPGLPITENRTISLQGEFIDKQTVQPLAFHVHSSQRDIKTLVGLIGILSIWMVALLKKRSRVEPPE